MKVSSILTIFLLVLPHVCVSAHKPIENEEYSRHLFTDSSNNTMPYRMLSPVIKDGEKYPLVIFLHGSGERGDDNEKQLTYGASTFSNPSNVDKYPSYVLFPQCREKSWTYSTDAKSFMPGANVPPLTESEKMIVNLIKEVMAENPIDPARIYIVGISMGGIAAYDIVCTYPNLFAAVVPICGAVNPERLISAKDVKFMIFHGAEDKEIPSVCGREAYKALNASGAEVEYIEFAGVGHECWSLAFNYPNFLPWLFSQTKNFQKANY